MKRLFNEEKYEYLIDKYWILDDSVGAKSDKELKDFIDTSIKSAVRAALEKVRPNPAQMRGQSGEYFDGHSDCFVESTYLIDEILKEYE